VPSNETTYVSPTEALLPSVLAGAREAVLDFVQHWGASKTHVECEAEPVVEIPVETED